MTRICKRAPVAWLGAFLRFFVLVSQTTPRTGNKSQVCSHRSMPYFIRGALDAMWSSAAPCEGRLIAGLPNANGTQERDMCQQISRVKLSPHVKIFTSAVRVSPSVLFNAPPRVVVGFHSRECQHQYRQRSLPTADHQQVPLGRISYCYRQYRYSGKASRKQASQAEPRRESAPVPVDSRDDGDNDEEKSCQNRAPVTSGHHQ